MIEPLIINKNTDYSSLVRFITKKHDYDFHFFENKGDYVEKFYANNVPTLQRFLRSGRYIYVDSDVDGYCGLAFLWKPNKAVRDRFYLKIRANSHKIARDLITVLLWNVPKEIFVRFRNDNEYLSILQEKGFRVLNIAGGYTLLSKKPNKEIFNVRNNHNFTGDNDTLQSKRYSPD